MSESSHHEFERIIRTYLNVDAPLVDDLRQYLQENTHLEATIRFRMELANAILHDAISPEEYERLTYEDFNSQDDLRAWLIELWHSLYGNVPVIAPD